MEHHEPRQLALDNRPPTSVPQLIHCLETRLAEANAQAEQREREWHGTGTERTADEQIAWGYHREAQGVVDGLRQALDLARGEGQS